MLKIIHFIKHFGCHLQGEYVLVGTFWKPYIGQAVRGEWYVMNLIGRTEEWTAIQLVVSTWLRKKCEKFFMGPMVRRRGDERSFDGRVNQERS
jgi:hypothetical protein